MSSFHITIQFSLVAEPDVICGNSARPLVCSPGCRYLGPEQLRLREDGQAGGQNVCRHKWAHYKMRAGGYIPAWALCGFLTVNLCYIWRYGRVAAVAGWGSAASVRQEAWLGDHDGNPFWPWDQQFLVLICCCAASFFKIRGTQRVDHDQMSTSERKLNITDRPSRRKTVSMFIFPCFPLRFTPSPFIFYNQYGCVLSHCPPFPNSVIHFQGFGIWDTLI